MKIKDIPCRGWIPALTESVACGKHGPLACYTCLVNPNTHFPICSDMIKPVSANLRQIHRRLIAFSLILCLPLISGCLPAVVGGAIGGAELITERRTVQRVLQDNSLEIKIRGVSKQDEMLANTNISVTAYNGWVLLSGEVETDEQRKQAEKIADSYDETRRVINALELSGVTSLASRGNDSVITGKIKLTMKANENVPATNIKVVTEGGIVYLMGLVTREEGEHAVEVAKNISGVRKIVKVFEYIVE